MEPGLDVVIVNWNSGGQLRRCLASLAGAERSRFRLERVVVVDNASTDGSTEGLAAAAADNTASANAARLPLEVVVNERNLGFAAGCNQGAGAGRAPLLLFLNPDTVLEPNSLAIPVSYLTSPEGQGAGIAGIRLDGEDGRVHRHTARFPGALAFWQEVLGLHRLWPERFPGVRRLEWDHLESKDVDHVVGAFYLVRRELFERLGGFDERYFLYLEDLDFSLRARRAGARRHYIAEARAMHVGGGTSSQARPERLFRALESRLAYARRHLGPAAAASVTLGTLLVEPWTRFALAAIRADLPRLQETAGAYRRLFASLARRGAAR